MKNLMIITLALLAMSCSSDDDDEVYSNGGLNPRPINVEFNINAMDYDLSDIGSIKYISMISGPTAVVVHTASGFKAYNHQCSYDDPEVGRGQLYFTAKAKEFSCTKECGSKFDVNNGLPISGIAKEKHLRLLEYKVTPQEKDGVYLITDK